MESNNSTAGSAGNGTGNAGVGNGSSVGLAVNALTGAINETLPGSPPAVGMAGINGKVATSFLTVDTDAQFILDTGRIVGGMAGNKAFPTPAPAMSEVIAAREAYLAAVTAGLDSRLGRSLRKKNRAALVFLLRQLAHYVEDTSAGDRTLLMSSGFPLQRRRSPTGLLPAPILLRMVKGRTSGTAIARCQRVGRARAYQWRIAAAATPTAWMPVITTFGAHAQFEGLAPTAVYVVQVCVVGTAGVGDWSEVATALVL